MGLITDPLFSANDVRVIKILAQHKKKICFLLYFVSTFWFLLFGMHDLNHPTYLSENALSPGLVFTEVSRHSEKLALQYHKEFLQERQYKKGVSWILAKMKQIGLETHVHNYSLKSFGKSKIFTGTNIYGILRAPRISSTEGIVFSAPLREADFLETSHASISILLAFAEFSKKKNYWAKDLIFLVTSNEQLGIQAWLEAYHLGDLQENKNILNSGNLPARAGALQAALNLEFQDLHSSYINVKIEGLNGGLPNLDYFNLVQKITSKERIPSGYKHNTTKLQSFEYLNFKDNIKRIISMVLSQANCVPSGNHGLFHQYRIEALTLEGIKSNSNKHKASVLSVIKLIEGISRSLNNLLEKFHQSFFFYILVNNYRFVSIGDYMPCAILFVAVFFLKSFFIWYDIHKNIEDECNDFSLKKKLQENLLEVKYFKPILIFVCAIALGVLLNLACKNHIINEIIRLKFELSIECSVTLIIMCFSLMALSFPAFFKIDELELRVVQIGTQVFIGCILLTVSLLNFSLGFILGVFITPIGIFNEIGQHKTLKYVNTLYIVLCHPVLVICYFSVEMVQKNFENLAVLEFFEKVFIAFSNISTYAVMDNLIYGNYIYSIATLLLFPAWILVYNINIRNLILKKYDMKMKLE